MMKEATFGIPMHDHPYFLGRGVQEILDIDLFNEPKNTIELGLIQDETNLMTQQDKQSVELLPKAMQSRDKMKKI